MTQSTSNLKTIQDMYAAFVEGDLGPLFAALSDEIVWNSHSHPVSPFHGIHRGIPAVEAYFGKLPDVDIERFDVKAIFEADDKVIALIDQCRVTKSTGLAHDGLYVHVWGFNKDGKMNQVDIFENSADIP